MNERRLRIFYELSTTRNMTLVAEKLFISQPAVSQAIKELETELGTPLFDRGRKMELTYAGEVYLGYVKRILNLYDESYAVLRDIFQMKKGRLKLGASTTIGIYVLPDIIGQFFKQYREVDVSLTIENTKHIAERVWDGAIDFAFVEGEVQNPDIVVEEFCADRLAMIVPPDHAWAAKGVIEPQDLIKEKILMRESGSGTREVFENALAARRIQYNIAWELGNTEAIKNAVAAGLGISCVSERCIIKEVAAGTLAKVEIMGVEIERRFNLIYHRDKYITALFDTFIVFARKLANNHN